MTIESEQQSPDITQDVEESTGQMALLRSSRFGPYFLTQLLGAFNDNVYKNALVAVFAFSVSRAAADSEMLINLAAGMFILPFFLFSALGGQIADKYEKGMLIQRIKLAEIAIMVLAAIALFLDSTTMLIVILFFMGTQSAFFGPIKYGILPQHLSRRELVGGNGLVEMGTFLAILAGTIAGTQLVSLSGDYVAIIVSAVVILVAITGFIASKRIPAAAATDPGLKINFNPVTETWRLVSYTKKHRVIFQSILGISWFWMLGALYLAQFPVYARDVLGGGVNLYTLLLALFSVGIGVGSLLCEKFSDHRVEIGLVPFGALGLTLFGLDLWWSSPVQPQGTNMSILEFLGTEGSFRLCLDVLMIGVFGGFYIVPLYALIQQTSKPDRLSRAIACNNILNAFFMVVAALLAIGLLGAGLSIPRIFLIAALLNAVVAIYIFTLVPEFLMRFLTWILIHTIYRVEKEGLENIPDEGAVILAPNHISFVDPLIVGGCVRRPVRFVMYYKIFRIPVLNFVFRTARAIPIAGRTEDREMFDNAFLEMEKAIDNGDVLCIFPEGQITTTGEMNEFKPGIMHLLKSRPVPVIPVALRNLWGSMFSRMGGPTIFRWPRKLFARIGLIMGEPIPPEEVSLESLQIKVLELRGPKR